MLNSLNEEQIDKINFPKYYEVRLGRNFKYKSQVIDLNGNYISPPYKEITRIGFTNKFIVETKSKKFGILSIK